MYASDNGLFLSLQELDIEKFSFLWVVFGALNRKKKADRNSDKEYVYMLKYKIRPFTRQSVDAFRSVQLHAANDSHVLFSLKPTCRPDSLSAFCHGCDPP